MPLQAEIYERLAAAELDPELSWSESDLPERQRTKHVHRLHPYLGKYVPQLVEMVTRAGQNPGHGGITLRGLRQPVHGVQQLCADHILADA